MNGAIHRVVGFFVAFALGMLSVATLAPRDGFLHQWLVACGAGFITLNLYKLVSFFVLTEQRK